MTSEQPYLAPVPATITIPAGSTYASFTITPMAHSTVYSSIITATYNSSSAQQELVISPDYALSVSLNPTTILDGGTATGAVTLQVPAPTGGWVVTLISQHPYVMVPSSVTVPAGATSTTFPITTTVYGSSYLNYIAAADTYSYVTAVLNVDAAPSAPTGLLATAATDQVSLSWTAVTGATSYSVYRGTTSGTVNTQIASGVTSTTFLDTALTDGNTYYYAVKALSGIAASGNSNVASAMPYLLAPTGLTAVAGNATVYLYWTPSPGASGYNVLRSTTNGSGYTLVASTASTSFTDPNALTADTVTNGTTYYYIVSAYDSSSNSTNSSQAAATPEPSYSFVDSGYLVTFSGGSDSLGVPPEFGSSGTLYPNIYEFYQEFTSDTYESITGPMTVTFTWLNQSPAPDYVSILLGASASSPGSNASVADGLNDPPQTDSYGALSSGSKTFTYTDPPESFSITLDQSSSGSPELPDEYQDTIINIENLATPTIVLTGTTPGSSLSGVNVAPGQQLTALVGGQGFSKTPYDTYQWTITLPGGTIFKSYQPDANSAIVVNIPQSDLKSPTLSWFFSSVSQKTTATISCVYTNSANPASPYTLTTTVAVVPPTIQSPAKAADAASGMQFLPSATPSPTSPTSWLVTGATSSLLPPSTTAGMIYSSIVTDPPNNQIAPSSSGPGNWFFVQLVNDYTVTINGHSRGNTPNTDLDNNTIGGNPGLYPGTYPYTALSSNSYGTSGGQLVITDNPGIKASTGSTLNPANTYQFSSNFFDYMFYMPPVATNGATTSVCYVPVNMFTWSVPTWTATPPPVPGQNWTQSGNPPVKPSSAPAVPSTFPQWLSPPTSVNAAPATGGPGITVSWTAPPVPPTLTTIYDIYRGSAGTNLTRIVTGYAMQPLKYTDTTAPGGTTFYAVVARCSAPDTPEFDSDPSLQSSASIAPATPTNFNGSVSGSTVTLTWTPVPGATSYTIAEGSEAEGSSTSGPFPHVAPPGNGSTFTSTMVPPGTYYYVITANSVTASGTTLSSPQSAAITVTVP